MKGGKRLACLILPDNNKHMLFLRGVVKQTSYIMCFNANSLFEREKSSHRALTLLGFYIKVLDFLKRNIPECTVTLIQINNLKTYIWRKVMTDGSLETAKCTSHLH